MGQKTKVVILGGGFGGIYTAMYLEKKLRSNPDLEIHLVNKENYFVYQPMLAEVVGGSVGITDTVSSIRRLLPKTKLYVRDIESIDLANKKVLLAPVFDHSVYELTYDHLVFALGNVTDFRGSPGLHEHALPFKNLADSIVIRNRVIDAIETASTTDDPELRKKMLTFVVGGGGFSGTEVVAEVNDFARKLAKSYPSISKEDIRVVMVHSKDRLLEREMPEKLGRYAGDLLQKRGVEIKFNARLASATPEEALLESGEKIPTKTVISSVPSSPNPLIESLDLPTEKGRIKVASSMLVENADHLWAIGDCAMIPLAKGDTFAPPTAQFAIREAKCLAKNIVAKLKGKELQPFYFKALGMLGALGHHSAVADLFGIFRFSGIFAWLLWRAIYWIKLPGISRKIKVAFSWILETIIPSESVQLKIEPTSGITTLHYEPGEVIFKEGDIGDYLYIIADGKVEVYQTKDGTDKTIATLSKGEYFGEMALLNQKMRTASVRCIQPTNLLALKKTDFGALIANLDDIRKTFEETHKSRSQDLSKKEEAS